AGFDQSLLSWDTTHVDETCGQVAPLKSDESSMLVIATSCRAACGAALGRHRPHDYRLDRIVAKAARDARSAEQITKGVDLNRTVGVQRQWTSRDCGGAARSHRPGCVLKFDFFERRVRGSAAGGDFPALR